MADQAPQNDRKPLSRVRLGKVTSDQRDKTCTVEVTYLARHSKYGKFVRRRSRVHVHDPQNQATIGDKVRIAPCRPISKTKAWRLVEVVEAVPKDIAAIAGS